MKSEQSYALQIPYLREFGLRINDIFRLEPMQGRGRELELKRVKIVFSLENLHAVKVEGDHISLPHTDNIGDVFELELVWDEALTQETSGRFLLKSLKNIPFKIGQVYSREAYLSRGDEVILGHNRISFFAKQENEYSDYGVSISSALAKSPLNILIEGETGTGKSSLAKKIHELSGRSGRFVSVNLSSFSPTLIESELFGHVKGAFTGAIQEKSGALIEANNGTLFIDEIDSLPLEIQTKLLLFLDSKMVRPVGGNIEKKTTARLIFASGTTLTHKIEKGEMRKDFYFRLKMGESIGLIPLRDQPQKIKKFCENFSRENGIYISKSLVDFYCRLRWPGNIRELKGHLEKKKVLCQSRRLEFDIHDEQLRSSSLDIVTKGHGMFVDLETVKRNYSINVYHKLEKDIKKATNILKITPATLRGWLKEDINCSERLSS